MPTDSDLISIIAQGNDRSLSQNGDDRFYWYSVKDMMTLLVHARKEYLRYENDVSVAPPTLREEYSPLRQNYQNILVADPCHQINFATYLSDDITKIIGDGTQMFWRNMPEQIIIPLLFGANWRLIRIQILYLSKTVSILWDDPHGEGAFPQILKDTLLDAIIPNMNRLIVKVVGDSEFRLSLDDVVQVDKVSDQRGKGGNAWDCGPIIMSNIIDYIKNPTIENTRFSTYSISDSSHTAHEQQMIYTRNLNRVQYYHISIEHLDNDRLILLIRDECQIAETFINKLNSFPHPYQQQFAELSLSKVNILFALMDSNSNRQYQELGEDYSLQEVETAMKYIHRHITPISFDPQKKEESYDVNEINALLKIKSHDLHRLSFTIGTHDFAKIAAEGRDFVDKSLFIKEIIETGDEVTMITRPRRWGKTVNLNMLSKFFAMHVNESGNAIVTSPYRELFQRLRIGQKYPELIDKHQGKYPVIFFTFREIPCDTYQEIKSWFINEIMELYNKYSYLDKSAKINSYIKDKFHNFISGNISELEIKESIYFLCSLLQMHHGKEVYLFIDEYDALFNSTFDTEEFHKTLELMRSFLGRSLKGNNSLKKAVVTGLTNIAKSGLYFNLNNVREYSILKQRYAEYFGFTEDEVKNLLQKANITDIRVLSAVTDYYNGYQIGDYAMYNPSSVIYFLTDLELSSYWANTEGVIARDRKISIGLLIDTIMQSTVRELIKNCYAKNRESIDIAISPDVVLNRLKQNSEAMWTVLAFAGYLSLSNVRKLKGGQLLCKARIPNKDILEIYQGSISLWFTDVLGIDLEDLVGSSVLNIEDIGEFENLVRKLLLLRSEIFGDANESLFHSLVEGLIMIMGTTHRLSSEKRVGSGRINSIFYPIIGKSRKIIIHEYKILGNTNTSQIDSKLQDALWQVYEHYYFEEVVSKQKEFNCLHYQQMEVRGIVVFVDENTNALGMMLQHRPDLSYMPQLHSS